MAKRLETQVSDSLWHALQERSASSGQSVSHIAQAALAEALDVEHHSIFQVSTSGAIVEGLYQGCVSVGDLRRHGDLGLGTFEDLDGEMILIDGHCYQARSDGTVTEASDDELTPFASVVSFVADQTHALSSVTSWDDLQAQLNGLRTSANAIVAFRATGVFDAIKVRTACKHESGTDLVSAVADQAIFDFAQIEGSLVGFWSPEYTQAIAIAGYHLHFISADRQHGGHVLDLTARNLPVEVHQVTDLHLAIPETREFLAADLGGDTTEALNKAERNPGAR
ncbi:MAG: acetolactate decarboxylase [Actinomycetota bacterium]